MEEGESYVLVLVFVLYLLVFLGLDLRLGVTPALCRETRQVVLAAN